MTSTPLQERQDRILADIIKETHSKLRNQVRKDLTNDEEIWKQHVSHVQATSEGQKYADAMKALSEEHWDNEGQSSRIKWISEKIDLYFHQGDDQRFISRLERKQNEEVKMSPRKDGKVEILDVGSCYNPFKKVLGPEKYQITAIDLNPASYDVIKADFIQINDLGSFDAVIFCLLLEYLPSSKLRLKAVKKAIRILKPFGLLVIVTPDSSHQGKNMNQMKSWRLAMLKMGMIRISIEKLKHVHCLAFVKVEKSDFSLVFDQELERMKKKYDQFDAHQLQTAFYIPQDLVQ